MVIDVLQLTIDVGNVSFHIQVLKVKHLKTLQQQNIILFRNLSRIPIFLKIIVVL